MISLYYKSSKNPSFCYHRILWQYSPYRALASSIVGFQTSRKLAFTILHELLGIPLPTHLNFGFLTGLSLTGVDCSTFFDIRSLLILCTDIVQVSTPYIKTVCITILHNLTISLGVEGNKKVLLAAIYYCFFLVATAS